MSENPESKPFRRKIYIDGKGNRYIEPEELLRDPDVRERLESARRLAERLGLRRKND